MISRRTVLAGAAAVVTPAAIWIALRSGAKPAAPVEDHTLLGVITDLVIPPTDTPGAVQVGVPAFVALAVEHELNGSTSQVLADVQAELDAAAGRAFLSLPADRRYTVLEQVDAAAYAKRSKPAEPGADVSSWPILKGLILMGYYSSETGASQELRYVFVPGRYDPDIPFTAGDRAFYNDWWGNAF